MSKLDIWKDNHPTFINSLRKVLTLGDDLIALHPKLGIIDDISDVLMQKPDKEKTLEEHVKQLGTEMGLSSRMLDATGRYLKLASILNVPDFLLDAATFINDWSTPIEEFDGRKEKIVKKK